MVAKAKPAKPTSGRNPRKLHETTARLGFRVVFLHGIQMQPPRLEEVVFEHLQNLNERSVAWMTRSKEDMQFEIVGQQLLSKDEMGQARNMRGKGIFTGQQPIVPSDRQGDDLEPQKY